MKTMNLFEIWEKAGNPEEIGQQMRKEEIFAIVKRESRAERGYFSFSLLFYSLLLLAGIFLIVLNLPGYWANPTIRPVLYTLLFSSLFFVGFGIFLMKKFRELKKYQDSLVTQLKNYQSFYNLYFEIWIVIIALSCVILVFNINLFTDNDQGVYRINNPAVYTLLHLFIFFFVYGFQKQLVSHNRRMLKSHLTLLETGMEEEIANIQKMKRRQLIVVLTGLIAVLFMLLAGLILFLR